MSKPEYHVQCRMQKGNVHTTAWIQEEFAVLDKHLAMERPNNVWEEGWIVTHVGSKMESRYVKNFSHTSGRCLWAATSGPCPRGNK